MKDSQFVTIQGWMGNRLGLRGNDLICFAVIYGFSMDGESQFKGNLEYLCACMFASKPTVLLALNKLMECNLILKQDDVVKGKKRCYYATNVIYDEGEFTAIDTSKAPLPMTGKDPLPMTGKAPLPKEYNNKEYNKEDKEKNKSNDLSKNKRFVKPTVEQIGEYIREKKLHFEAERFFDYYESKGWMIGKNHMKDWKAACRTWEAKRKSEIKEEEKEELPAGLTPETWALRQGWMYKFIPRIAERITPDMFLTLQGLSHFKPDVFKDIIEDIDKSDFNGDIVTEFDRLRLTDNYASRIDL